MTPSNQVPKLDDVLSQVAKDKGIDKAVLVSTLEQAMTAAAKKHFGQDRALVARYNGEGGKGDKGEKGVVELYQTITIVAEVVDPTQVANQLTPAQAGKHGLEVQVGDELDFESSTARRTRRPPRRRTSSTATSSASRPSAAGSAASPPRR